MYSINSIPRLIDADSTAFVLRDAALPPRSEARLSCAALPLRYAVRLRLTVPRCMKLLGGYASYLLHPTANRRIKTIRFIAMGGLLTLSPLVEQRVFAKK